MKYYIKKDLDIATIVDELTNMSNVKAVDKEKYFIVSYRPENEIDSEVVKIDKTNKSVVFSATSTLFKKVLKDKITEV